MSRPLPRSTSFGQTMAGEMAVAAGIIVGRLSWKQTVDVATTANVTIASALNAGDTIDGVTLVAGMRVLVWQQTAQAENGIYIVDATPFRSQDFDESGEIVGSLSTVTGGSTYAQKVFRNTNLAAVVVDTDAITFEEQTAHVDSIGDVGDVETGGVTSGDVLVWDGTSWVVRASGAHVHVVGEPFVGDGAQTVYYLANEAELDTVAAYTAAGARVAITQDTTQLDKITFTAAPAAGTGWIDYIAALS